METVDSNETSVSIIIPAFNVERWIEQCIESALGQSYRNLEVVVIDDGSSDGTWSIIQRFAESDSRLHPIRQENQGPSAARNRGIQLSKGEFLLFLDADDWIHPDTVADAVKLFRKLQPDVVMFQCAKYFERTNEWSCGTDDFYWRSVTAGSSDTEKALDVPAVLVFYPLAQLKIVAKSFLVKSGLTFIEDIRYEDNPFHVSLLCLNPLCAFLPKKYYAWRQERPGQFTGTARVADCHIALKNMLESANQLESNALPFLIICVTRLICGVARCIIADGGRQHFIDGSARIIRESLQPGRLEAALDWIPSAANIHPADRVLASALFARPDLLSAALGSGKSRYWASIKILAMASKAKSAPASLFALAKSLSSIRLLINYSRGVGECNITGLG